MSAVYTKIFSNNIFNYVVDNEQTTQATKTTVSNSTGVNIGAVVMSVAAAVIVLTLIVFILTLLMTRHTKLRLIELFYCRFHYRIGY